MNFLRSPVSFSTRLSFSLGAVPLTAPPAVFTVRDSALSVADDEPVAQAVALSLMLGEVGVHPASRATASMRRPLSLQISSLPRESSSPAAFSATTFNIGVSFLAGVPPPSLVNISSTRRYAAPPLRWVIHRFWL